MDTTTIVIDVLHNGKGYMFELPSLQHDYSSFYKVNGERVRSGKVITTDDDPVIELYQTVKKKVKAIPLVEGLSELTVEEYEEKLADLKNSDNFSAVGGGTFHDLDAEYEYKKFQRSYKLIENMMEVCIQTFDVRIQTKSDSDNPFIELHRHIGKGIMSQAATYNRWGFYKKYVRELLVDLGYEEMDSIASRKNTFKIYEYNKGMVNLYIEGKAVFDIKVYSFSDELAIVEAKYDEDKKWIEDKINAYVRNTRLLPSVQDIMVKVNGIKSRLSKIDYKVKSESDYRVLTTYINDLLMDLEKGNYSK